MSDFFAEPLLALDMPEGCVALTFDDGPCEQSGALGEYLLQHEIRAVFFVVGKRIEAFPKQTQLLSEMGHTLGNHTYSHVAMPRSINPVAEIHRTDQLISRYAQTAPILFRAPFGRWSRSMPDRLNDPKLCPHLGPIHWDIGSFGADWRCRGRATRSSIKMCGDRYLSEINAFKQGIVLMHDHPNSMDLVSSLIPRVLQLGYRFTDLYASKNLTNAAQYVMARRAHRQHRP
jgi:peptidoglycan/xylan/chitin deacetylase (PgdA/CDA1 family)